MSQRLRQNELSTRLPRVTVQACADIVRSGDPDRYTAAMAAPVAARAVLFPLYAFNAEVARAPWVTQETMIAEMRLQWWRDALEEIGSGGPVRRHEVTTPLAEVLDPEGAAILQKAIDARRWDIARDPFPDAGALWSHLDATAGSLMWASARALGADAGAKVAVSRIARAAGLAAWFQAVPRYIALGRRPLPDPAPKAIAALARDGLHQMKTANRRTVSPLVRPALNPGWSARRLLSAAAGDPGSVLTGTLTLSEFHRRLGLARLAIFGT